ncbi:amino acid adenylation domain-containing protein [Catenulispora pinisilvae]|uniref:amino acid adenylation domain-containing protein n=1 Tax=Catenulispora pinisilvae TaxID=2705253 RepID=UPI002B2666D7|nr:amino acid adenylation domain-containing protein [Catenulispora pinisilvae]
MNEIITTIATGVGPTSADSSDSVDGLCRITLPSRFTPEQAARAALLGDHPLSYAELDSEVDRVAAGLLRNGAGPGDRVAIWMDKQPRYAVAILGALRAGCAYLPLDAAQPAERVQAVLADAEPTVLCVDRGHLPFVMASRLPASVRVVAIADGVSGPAPGRAEVLGWEDFAPVVSHRTSVAEPDPGSVAAVLYTSGSTGMPKGVQITHRNLGAFIGWARQELDVGPDDVFAGHASFNFDLSTFDLFTALSVGASLWIVPDAQTKDMAALAAGIVRHQVTVWYSVPSVLHLLLRSGALTPDVAASLRHVLFAGEAFPTPQLRALAEVLHPATTLYNLYGPTETNVCTYHLVGPEDLRDDEPIPIGVPLPGARVSVRAPDGSEVTSSGELGELIVSGPCVTPGYWRRPRESAAAGHPASHATGDLVCLDDHGRLVYRGRKDRMVKLSGYRVELGEVEAAALRHPGIATAAAVVAAGPGGGAHIVLHYTVPSGAAPLGLLDLKRHCARYLPVYMVPRAAECVAALPYNANGKVDYQRLAAGGDDPPAAPPLDPRRLP